MIDWLEETFTESPNTAYISDYQSHVMNKNGLCVKRKNLKHCKFLHFLHTIYILT